MILREVDADKSLYNADAIGQGHCAAQEHSFQSFSD